MMAAKPARNGLLSLIQKTTGQVLDCLKQWNVPIRSLSSIAGVAVKPYHLALLGIAVCFTFKQVNLALHRRRHAERARLRKVELEHDVAQIPQLDRDVVSDELAQKMAAMTASQLNDELQRGSITAVQALLYFAAMSAEAHKRYNCLTNVMFPEALARAVELDRIFKETGRPVGPFHGMPISIKECISVKGTHNTAGLAVYLEKRAEQDASIVTALREAGALIYIKTNIPQTMLIADCSNPIYGRTLNPYSKERTSGGSSGGEGVVVASGGAPIGVGTDIGGSIRMPGAWCGIMGMMPTPGRFAGYRLAPEVFPGIETLQSSCGPIAHCAEDAALFYRVLAASNMSNIDKAVPRVAFDESVYGSKAPLVIGYFLNDGHFTASVASQRAVMLAIETLRAKGHTVVEFVPHEVYRVLNCFFTFVTGDGEWNLRPILAREKIDPCIEKIWGGMTSPWPFRFLAHSLFRLIGWRRMANIIPIWSGSAEYEHRTASWRNNYQRELIARMKDAGLDAIICPGPAIPAPLHDMAQLMAPALSSTYFWNVVKFPAASMAITTVQAGDLATPRTVHDLADVIANRNDVGSEGLPIPVQIVSYPWNDERVLRVANELDSLSLDLSTKLRSSIAASLP